MRELFMIIDRNRLHGLEYWIDELYAGGITAICFSSRFSRKWIDKDYD